MIFLHSNADTNGKMFNFYVKNSILKSFERVVILLLIVIDGWFLGLPDNKKTADPCLATILGNCSN